METTGICNTLFIEAGYNIEQCCCCVLTIALHRFMLDSRLISIK